MMNFTFNFFFPFVTAFTTLCTAALFNGGSRVSPTNANAGSYSGSTATVAQSSGRPRRTRTRVPRSAMKINGSTNGQIALRRSARLQHKYVIPEKHILSSAPRRRRTLRREGAIADLRQFEPGIPTASNAARRQLQREDSFILVDHGNHFRMVKPAYAMRYFHSVPENIKTVAPYHALGANVGEQELRARLLAIPISATPPIGTKRVRFVTEEEGEEHDDNPRPRKRRRSS